MLLCVELAFHIILYVCVWTLIDDGCDIIVYEILKKEGWSMMMCRNFPSLIVDDGCNIIVYERFSKKEAGP